MPLDIEHINPEALGGPTTRENLWLACTRFNDSSVTARRR
jgi:5-methylcytosine-specific restriction endonuclease McrA